MAQPDPTLQRKPGRRTRRLLAAVGLGLLGGLVGVVIFRQELATHAATVFLEDQGIAVSSLKVTRLWFDGIEVGDLALGEEDEITARQVQLKPSFEGFSVSLQEVKIDSLRLRIDLRGDEPLLGSLQPVLDRLSSGQGSNQNVAEASYPPMLPPVTLSDAKVILETPSGPMTADLSGGLSNTDEGDLIADFTAHLDSDLGRLRAKLTGRRISDGKLSLDAGIEEGRLAWEGFAVSGFAGQISLTHAQATGPRLDAALDLTGLSYQPAEGAPLQLARGSLSAKGGLSDLALELLLDGDQEALKLKVDARTTPATERQGIDFRLQTEARTAGGLAQFLNLAGARIVAGTMVVEAKGSGSLAEGVNAPRTWPEAQHLLAGSRFELDGDVILAGLALADGSQGISAHLPLAAELAENRLLLSLTADSAVRVEKPARSRLRNLGVPEDLLPLIASGLSLTLKAGGDLPFRISSAPAWPPRAAEVAVAAQATSDQDLQLIARAQGAATFGEGLALTRFSASIDSRTEMESLALDGIRANGLALDLPFTAEFAEEGLRLALADPGEVRIGQIAGDVPLRLGEPLVLTVTELNLEAAAGAPGYRYSLRAEEDGAGLRLIQAADTQPIPLRVGALALQLDGRFDPASGHDAALDARSAGLDLPDYAFSSGAATARIALGRQLLPEGGSFAVGPLQLGGEQPRTAPLRLTGGVKRTAEGYGITAELGLSEGPPLADIAARLGDDGQARVEAVSKALAFAPDGLQPARISPLLDVLEEVRGSLSATANFAWPQDPAAEFGRVTISDLSFRSSAGEIEGLSLDLVLSSLLPLASAPAQSLKIRSLDAAVPVDAIELVFALAEAPNHHLSIESGGFGLGGTRWRIEPAIFDPAATSNRIVLATDALDLAAFFELTGIDGLSGSGTLKGSLPIVFQGEDVIVDEGRFVALTPGRISVRIEALRSALAGSGETVEMAIKALEDFYYDDLSLTLAKTAANDATVLLSILGQNPQVLDGQLFRFNINLESNLTSVLEALRQGYSLSDDALRRAWRLHE